MRRTQRRIAIPALVSAIVQNGGGFHFSEAGSLFADNLGNLPTYLRDEFFDCNERELVRFLRSQAGQAEAMSNGRTNAYTGAKNALVAA